MTTFFIYAKFKIMKESFLIYIENNEVIVNMISTDGKIQETIKQFIADKILPYSMDKLGLNQIVTKSPAF